MQPSARLSVYDSTLALMPELGQTITATVPMNGSSSASAAAQAAAGRRRQRRLLLRQSSSQVRLVLAVRKAHPIAVRRYFSMFFTHGATKEGNLTAFRLMYAPSMPIR